MQDLHHEASPPRTLLSARQVQDLLNVDRSTVYRMAESGRLPAIKVGKQWRFPAEAILAMIAGVGSEPGSAEDAPGPPPGAPGEPTDPTPGFPARGGVAGDRHLTAQPMPPRQRDAGSPRPPEARVAQAAIDVAAPLLGVMMVVTDIAGAPITAIANPCPWFAEHAEDPEVVDACLAEWRDLANLDDLQPKFGPSAAGFECARAFIRSGSSLIGMVLAGGVNPPGVSAPGRFDLDADRREHVLAALPRIAASLTRPAPTPLGAPLDSAREPSKETR